MDEVDSGTSNVALSTISPLSVYKKMTTLIGPSVSRLLTWEKMAATTLVCEEAHQG